MSWPLWAMTYEDGQLLRKDYLLYQAWSVSRNYHFGSTVKPNKLCALAWQLVYINLLPPTYPQKEKLITPYQEGLTSKQIKKATAEAQRLMADYKLKPALSEEELSRAYVLRDITNDWLHLPVPSVPLNIASKFKHWITWVADNVDLETAESLDKYAYNLFLAHQFPIVYGQIIVKGPESPEMVQTNKMDVKISSHGFFVGRPTGHRATFTLAGYKPVVIKLTKNIQPIRAVVLEPLPHHKQTGLIGRVLPWHGLTQGNILLMPEDALIANQNKPWLQPTIPLTITEAGEFYTTGLAAGRYQLFINTAGISTKIKVAVKDNEVRSLSLIRLNR